MTKREQYTSTRNRLAVLALFLLCFLGVKAQTEINDLAGLNDMTASGSYIIKADINASGYTADITDFSGTLECGVKADGTYYKIIGLTKPLFNSIYGGKVKNVMLSEVNINLASGNAGAITKVLEGTSTNMGVIYNCGVLSGRVGSSGSDSMVGGLVGSLGISGSGNTEYCYARVINCFSYATITGGAYVAGIAGYNYYSTKANDIRTMVMNCMFYGDITGGTSQVAPIYGGNTINNVAGEKGLNTFNYYAYDKLKTKAITEGKYNCALAVEEKYLKRFEFYRLLLNSNKKLAAIYATGSADNADQMLKWVLETADRTIDNPMPYPVLKARGRFYPSIINPDIEHAPDSTSVGPNKGGKLGRTLSVTISAPDEWTNAPDGVKLLDANGNEISTFRTFYLIRTDKDFDRFNFNYDKVQLPYYNDYGTKNCTDYKVVTGWKIIDITALDDDPYTDENYDYTQVYTSSPTYFDYPNYNFADRTSSNKDKYEVSGRVFPQGGYFDVPYGVTEITIEPYWGNAVYLSDKNYDVVYKRDFGTRTNVDQMGTQVGSDTQFNSQTVNSDMATAVNALDENTTVYDQAIVLVGNFHQFGVPSNGTKAFTIMSVDQDNDREPDYSLIYHHKGRQNVCPIRFDFLSMPGTAQAQKPNGNTLLCNYTIFKTRGWFEVTNTAFYYTNQIEYENGALGGTITKDPSPLILLGGIFDQFVSTQSSTVNGKTIYIHVGGNVWIDQFGLGTHGDGKQSTPHVPVSVTGGEFMGFYLTGTYNQNAYVRTDNAECYVSGGYFHEAAGASQEQINGSVQWQIYNADIEDFYGGGTNDAKPIKGDVTVDIFNSRVTTYCGGPKFGNMQTVKKVTTKAEGCTFGKFFGGGYGGLSYTRKKYYDNTTYDWPTLEGYYFGEQGDRGKYYDGAHTGSSQISGKDYGYKGPGVATDFDYEFFVWSTGETGARFYVKFASFSLAQCNDVESKLKGCVINENFYGGGSLGKVIGTVTSELDGCTVKGNVYGAGFSASLPTIQVRDEGFAEDHYPNYNNASGLFEPGEFSGTTEFKWFQKSEYPTSEGAVGFLDDEGHYDIDGRNVVTTVDITNTNLGSVEGNVELTIKGNSVVFGNVYGGGEESLVKNPNNSGKGNTEVKIMGQTKVLGNIYGGGNMGEVEGNTKVIVNSGSGSSGGGGE